jgi:beta-lactamase regulating signal transducer with metallopeptidase domain
MAPSLNWINSASSHWWQYVIVASWQAAIVGSGLLLAVHLAGRRWPAPFRYALLVLALLKFACPPLLPVPTGLFSHAVSIPKVFAQTLERKPTPATASLSEPRSGGRGAGGLELGQLLAAGRRVLPAWVRSTHWTVWLMIVLGTGALVLVGMVCRRAREIRRLMARHGQGVTGAVSDEYRDLAIELGVYPIPSLVVSNEVKAPMAFGFSRAAVVLPAAIVNGLSADELRAVLAHELAHCKRGDLWLNWVQLILLAAWWFHPVVWLVNRSLRETREDCCDDLLLARGLVGNDAYCDVLMRAAAELSPVLPLSAALGFGGRLHPLGRRLARITDWSLQRAESVSGWGAAIILVCAAVVFPGAGDAGANGREVSTLPSAKSVEKPSQGPSPAQRVAEVKEVPDALNPPTISGPAVSTVQQPKGTNSAAPPVAAKPGGRMLVPSGATTPGAKTTRRSLAWSNFTRFSSQSRNLQPMNPFVPALFHTSSGLVAQRQENRLFGQAVYLRPWPVTYAAAPASYRIWVDRLPGTGLPGFLY